MKSITILDYANSTLEILYVPDEFNFDNAENYLIKKCGYKLSDIYYMCSHNLTVSSKIVEDYLCKEYLFNAGKNKET